MYINEYLERFYFKYKADASALFGVGLNAIILAFLRKSVGLYRLFVGKSVALCVLFIRKSVMYEKMFVQSFTRLEETR